MLIAELAKQAVSSGPVNSRSSNLRSFTGLNTPAEVLSADLESGKRKVQTWKVENGKKETH